MGRGWVVVVLLAGCTTSNSTHATPDASKRPACVPGETMPDPSPPKCAQCAVPTALDGAILDGSIGCLPTGQWVGKYRYADACACATTDASSSREGGHDGSLDAPGSGDGSPDATVDAGGD